MFDYFKYKQKIKNGIYKIISQLFYSKFFYSFGKNSKIVSPLTLKNTQFVSIGKNTTINDDVFLMVEISDNHNKECSLTIGNGVTIGHYNHIVALESVVIEDNVLTADRVYISDNAHNYENIDVPILNQKISSKKNTRIGKGSWLGENVCVISSNIGRNCVVAANSVVLSDIPDYSVAAGSPAVVKKRYDLNSKQWIKV